MLDPYVTAIVGPPWKLSAALKGHRADVTDMDWAPDSSGIITGWREGQRMRTEEGTVGVVGVRGTETQAVDRGGGVCMAGGCRGRVRLPTRANCMIGAWPCITNILLMCVLATGVG